MNYRRKGEMCYLPSLQRAWEMLGQADVPTLADRGGGKIMDGGLAIKVLDGRAFVDLGQRMVSCDIPESGLLLEIVILHYLKGCLGSKDHEGTDWLLFRQLPGGEAFQAAFQKRVVQAIADRYSGEPSVLMKAGLALGGRKEDFGSATVVLPFLPRLEVRVTVWQGDDEVPGNATVLFSPGASSYLPTEDFAEVGSVVINALARASNTDL